MKLRTVISFVFLVGTLTVFAGPKEDFLKKRQEAIDAGKKECSGIKPTGGRQGNVMKWKTCTADSITLDGCTLNCENAAGKIGG